MNKIIIFLGSIMFLCATCKNVKSILTYFPEIDSDSIVNTTLEQEKYYERTQKDNIPEKISLKYFFQNNTKEMHGVDEGYNVDDHSYTTVSYIKEVYPLFKKKNDGLYLLCYGIESKFYLAIFDYNKDEIINKLIISDFSDDMGNEVIHSIIFPVNNIVTLEIKEKTYCKLTKIDYKLQKFIEIKNIQVKQDTDIKDALSILGINEKGELLKD